MTQRGGAPSHIQPCPMPSTAVVLKKRKCLFPCGSLPLRLCCLSAVLPLAEYHCGHVAQRFCFPPGSVTEVSVNRPNIDSETAGPSNGQRRCRGAAFGYRPAPACRYSSSPQRRQPHPADTECPLCRSSLCSSSSIRRRWRASIYERAREQLAASRETDSAKSRLDHH